MILEVAVVVAGDRAGADVGACPDLGIPQIGQVTGLGPPTERRVLDLDQRFNFGVVVTPVRPHAGGRGVGDRDAVVLLEVGKQVLRAGLVLLLRSL